MDLEAEGIRRWAPGSVPFSWNHRACSDKPIPMGTNCQGELGGKTAGTMLLFTLH